MVRDRRKEAGEADALGTTSGSTGTKGIATDDRRIVTGVRGRTVEVMAVGVVEASGPMRVPVVLNLNEDLTRTGMAGTMATATGQRILTLRRAFGGPAAGRTMKD